MTKNPLTIREDETIGEATAKLTAQHHQTLPVVDADGRYAGMFGLTDLLSLLVPRVALAGNVSSNLRFITDDHDELRRKFHELKSRRVGEAANRNAVTLDPEAPETEAFRLFCRNRDSLAVVDKQSRKVLGMVSCGDSLRAIA